ncbi:hypothetical protein ACHHYP_04296 [Achlya hypogyna]|uniref:MYND-type domain-containing protein n=1 Tax=Achlya hypogyna TaxID=1202772 RepID=A0A1V9ZPB1_ACHHY|nr:hypothetical protein ACHHYP_04296 [Achlya hypogyna]
MEDVLICEDCRVPQAKRSGFRESQWDNPRPVCNACATNRAWTLFAADLAACPNAQVVHNHGVKERPTPAPGVVARPASEPLQWEREAAKKMQSQPKPSPQTGSTAEGRDDDTLSRWQSHPMWCSGCSKPTRQASRCSRCKRAHFCSTACQTSSWAQHKAVCTPQRTDDKAMVALCGEVASEDFVVCWKALTALQVRLSEGANVGYSTVESFLGHGGLGLLLARLEPAAVTANPEALETTWQVLLLLTRFVEANPVTALHLRSHGGVAVLARLLATADDLRLRASAIVALSTMLAAALELASTFVDLDLLPVFVALLSDAPMSAGQLRDEVDVVACLQSSALLLQLLEHGDHATVLDSLACFRLTCNGETATTMTILVDLLSKRDDMKSHGAATNSAVGEHLYFNVLTVVGILVHSEDAAIKQAFADAGFFPLWRDLVMTHLADDGAGPRRACDWLLRSLQTYVYDWRPRAAERRATTIAALDRIVGLATPFLRSCEFCQVLTAEEDIVTVAGDALQYAVAAYIASPDATSHRVVLASLDLFLCAVLPPFDMADADRAQRVHAHVDVVAVTLDRILWLLHGAAEPSEPLVTMLTETIKCCGLVAHFGQSMPLPTSTQVPKALAAILVKDTTPHAVQRVALAALVQWATSGNAVRFTDDVTRLLATAVTTLRATSDTTFMPILAAFQELIEGANSTHETS